MQPSTRASHDPDLAGTHSTMVAAARAPHAGPVLKSSNHLVDRAARGIITGRFPNRGHRRYVRNKLAGDPVYAAAARSFLGARPMPLLDVGCGIGLLGHYLHACDALHGYVGIDHDERKIETGRHAAEALGDLLPLRRADVADLPEFRGHIALLDVLHYLPAARQPELLAQLAHHVAPGGQLVIRNVVRERHWRFHATVLEEQFLYFSGWMSVRPTHYPSVDEITAPLQQAGLTTTVTPMWGHTPFNSYLIVAQRAD